MVGDGHPVEGDGEPAEDVGLGPRGVGATAGVIDRGGLGGGPDRVGGPVGGCRVGAREDLTAADVVAWVVRGDIAAGADRRDDAVRGAVPDGVCGGWLAGGGVRGSRVAVAATVGVGRGGGLERGGVVDGGQLEDDEVGELSVDEEEGGLGVWKSVSETEEGEEGSEVEEEEDMVQAG